MEDGSEGSVDEDEKVSPQDVPVLQADLHQRLEVVVGRDRDLSEVVRVVKQRRQGEEDASDVVQHRLFRVRQLERRRFDGSNDQRRFVTFFLKKDI